MVAARPAAVRGVNQSALPLRLFRVVPALFAEQENGAGLMGAQFRVVHYGVGAVRHRFQFLAAVLEKAEQFVEILI